jgi:DNA adenine methylase
MPTKTKPKYTRIKTTLKTHGGQNYNAQWIAGVVGRVPRTTYVEPYAGGLSVLFALDPEGVSEVVNDLDGELTNFWAVLGGPEAVFLDFLRRAQLTPFSEPAWERAVAASNEYRRLLAEKGTFPAPHVGAAVSYFVRCRQCLAGRTDTGEAFAGLTKSRLRGGMNEQVSALLGAVDRLPEVRARLIRVLVLNRDAPAVCLKYDVPGAVFYLDPPWLAETRAAPDVYRFEYTRAQHVALLDTLGGLKNAHFALSGLRSDLYDDVARLHHWTRHEKQVPNAAAGGNAKRKLVHCLWTNF